MKLNSAREMAFDFLIREAQRLIDDALTLKTVVGQLEWMRDLTRSADAKVARDQQDNEHQALVDGLLTELHRPCPKPRQDIL